MVFSEVSFITVMAVGEAQSWAQLAQPPLACSGTAELWKGWEAPVHINTTTGQSTQAPGSAFGVCYLYFIYILSILVELCPL